MAVSGRRRRGGFLGQCPDLAVPLEFCWTLASGERKEKAQQNLLHCVLQPPVSLPLARNSYFRKCVCLTVRSRHPSAQNPLRTPHRSQRKGGKPGGPGGDARTVPRALRHPRHPRGRAPDTQPARGRPARGAASTGFHTPLAHGDPFLHLSVHTRSYSFDSHLRKYLKCFCLRVHTRKTPSFTTQAPLLPNPLSRLGFGALAEGGDLRGEGAEEEDRAGGKGEGCGARRPPEESWVNLTDGALSRAPSARRVLGGDQPNEH